MTSRPDPGHDAGAPDQLPPAVPNVMQTTEARTPDAATRRSCNKKGRGTLRPRVLLPRLVELFVVAVASAGVPRSSPSRSTK